MIILQLLSKGFELWALRLQGQTITPPNSHFID